MISKFHTVLLLARASAPRTAAGPGAPPPPTPGPPAPAEKPAVEPPLPGEIPPDGTASAPRLDITGTFPKVKLIRILGMVWLLVAGVLALLFNHIFLGAEAAPINLALGYGLIAAGIGMGMFGFVNEDWRKLMSYLSAFAFVGGIAARPLVSPLSTHGFDYVLPGVLFAFSFFLYLEYLDAYQRFTDVGRMAVERSLPSINLVQVINNFLSRGTLLAAIFMGAAILLLTLVTESLAAALGKELGASIEMQAIFGQAAVIAIVFTVVGVAYVFLFMFLERKTDVEQVAYSREQIRDMVLKSQTTDEQAAPSGGGAPGSTPRGVSPGIIERP